MPRDTEHKRHPLPSALGMLALLLAMSGGGMASYGHPVMGWTAFLFATIINVVALELSGES